MRSIFILLFLVMSCTAQFQLHNYTLSHLPNPPEDQVTIYHYWYWEGDNVAECPLLDSMTYEQAMALPGALIDLDVTITDTLVWGTLQLQENGFWHRAGVIAENAVGQRSVMAVSPFTIKPKLLTNITKVRNLILERLP